MMPNTFDRNRLSAREDAILDLAIDGMTDIQIAQRLEITQSTVNSYWVRIRGKLGQLSRTELVALALKEKARQEMAQVQAQLGELREEFRHRAQITSDHANAETFRSAFDAMPEAVLIACEKGIIRFANGRLEAMFGYDEGELLGEPVESLVPPRIRERERERMVEYLKDPTPVRIGFGNVLYGQRRDGSLFRIVLLLDSRPTTSGAVVTCIVRDFATEVDQRREFVSSWETPKGELL